VAEVRTRHVLAILIALALAGGAWLAAKSFRSLGSARARASLPSAVGAPPMLPHQLTPERLKTLAERLLGQAGIRSFPPPSRNIFREAASEAPRPRPAPALGASPTPASPPGPPVSELSFTGFVERPGPSGSTEYLAVFRFEGEVHLVGEGENVGAYLVEKILNGEEVRLVDRATGMRRVFRVE